jgi:hypothetical protein
MTWENYLGVVSGGFLALLIAGFFCGFDRYLCIIGCVFIVACTAFGISGMITHSIGALPAEALPTP